MSRMSQSYVSKYSEFGDLLFYLKMEIARTYRHPTPKNVAARRGLYDRYEALKRLITEHLGIKFK